MFSPPSGSLLLILFRKFIRFALLFSDKVWLLLLLLNLYCCCCLSRSCVLLWLVHWRLYATTGVVTALYYTISKKIYHFSSLKRSMKDLHINQKSIINGVKRLTRGLCRVSSKVKNTNHILTYSDPKVTHSDPTHLPLPPPASPDNCKAIS